MKMKIIKGVKKILKLSIIKSSIKMGIGVSCLGSLIYGCSQFWRGFHSLDLAYNFLNTGFTHDTNTIGQTYHLKEVYVMGLNQMGLAFHYIVCSILLAFILGYLLRGEK